MATNPDGTTAQQLTIDVTSLPGQALSINQPVQFSIGEVSLAGRDGRRYVYDPKRTMTGDEAAALCLLFIAAGPSHSNLIFDDYLEKNGLLRHFRAEEK